MRDPTTGHELGMSRFDPKLALLKDETDELLEGEDPRTGGLEEAIRWMRVYADLLGKVLRAHQQADPTGLVGPPERVTRLERRLTFWKERCRQIAERYP